MIPNFEIFGKTISVYMLMALAGIFTMLFYTRAMALKKGLDEFETLFMLLYAMLGTAIGGHLVYGLTNFDAFLRFITHLDQLESVKQFFQNLLYIFGGSVYYGGLVGGLLAGYLYLRKKKLDIAAYADMAAPSIPLFHAIGRLGCFLSGCCYGIPCEFGFTYHYSLAPDANGISRFPVQLVEAGLNFILFFVLHRFLKSGKHKTHLLHIYLLTYPIYRFLLEFLRGDAYRGFLFGLSTSQIFSLVIFLGTGIVLLRERAKGRK